MRVLIVDDEPNICEGLAILSSRALGPHHTVACESDPVRALERMEEEQYDLLVTDISMPEIDGLELTRRARSRGLISHVVIVTGYEEFAYAREALRQGAVDFLLKPINKEELASALRRTDEILRSSDTRIPDATLAAQALLPGGARQATQAGETPSELRRAPGIAVIVTTMNGGSHVRNLARNAVRGVGGSQQTSPGVVVVPADHVGAVAALVPLAESDGPDASTMGSWRDTMQGYPIGIAVGAPSEDRLELVSDRAYSALLAASIYNESIVVWEASTSRGASAADHRAPIEERDLLSPRSISDAVERIVTSDWSTPLVRTDTCRQLVRLLAVRIAIATGVATA
ncbi:MAG TPA: response regulator, partial [Spirochaetia bacterium]|nr:response regulator [Spirochaetia bacterium]